MPGKSAFSELLKQHRRAAGYSQEALAERSGLSARAIAALEQGSRRAPYRDTVKALGDALGLSGDESAQLEKVAASARGRPRQEAPRIPVPLTSFIDRAEVGTILELLLEHHLLTVTGSGGVGKTRVAVEVARRFEERFDQTWFIDLLPIRDWSMLAPYIAARLNISVSGGDALSTIVRELSLQRAFLVLDNCEHLVAETATVLATLVRDCRQLTVLVTSREALGLVAESVFRLPPMNIEGATELFVARARTQDRSLFFDTERLEIAAEICKELDRIPLAIELAASRLPTLGFAELRKRLKSAAADGSRDLPVHHQTIVDTIRWSYDLLADLDRLVFERLSVFIGGFTLAAAEAVCAGESVQAAAIADIVPRLVRKSLIDAELIGTSTRYRFLETIRSFAWERLSQKGDVASVMLRLIEWLRDEALRLGTWYQSPEAVTVLRRELDNLVTSASWTISTGDAAAMVAAADALMNFSNAVFGTRRHEEIRQLIFGLLDRLRDSEHPEVVGLLICRTPAFLTFEEVPQLAARAIPLLISTGHRPEAATLHSRAAHCEIELGNAQAAEEHLSAGALLLTQEERTQSNYGIHFSVECAYVRSVLQDFAGARAAAADLVIPPGHLQPRIVFAEIEFREGHFQKALQMLEEPKRGLAAYPCGHPLRIMVFGNAAKYALLLGDARAAEVDLRQALVDVLDTSDHAQMFSSVFVQIASYAAVFAAKAGRLELAARLLGACDASSNPSNLDVDRHPIELAAPFLTSLSPEQAKALHGLGAGEDLYELIEEFLAA